VNAAFETDDSVTEDIAFLEIPRLMGPGIVVRYLAKKSVEVCDRIQSMCQLADVAVPPSFIYRSEAEVGGSGLEQEVMEGSKRQ
jgi:hypothetical protein